VTFKLPDFDPTPPIGFAVTTGPNEVRSVMVVPTAVMKGIAGYVMKIQQMSQAGAPGAVAPPATVQ
jgi:hypothetical protein